MRQQTIIRAAAIAASLLIGAFAFGVSAQNILERNVELIASPNVAQDMKLTEAQVSDSTKLFQAFTAFRDDTVRKMQALSQDKQEPLAGEIDSHREDLDRKLVALLTPAQISRLTQIAIQQEGFVAIQDDIVANELGLSAAQRAKVKTICATVDKAQDEYQSAVGEAMGKIPEPTTSDEASIKAYQAKQDAVLKSMKPQEKQYLAVKESGQKQIYNLMTPAQRTKWSAMHGKPLKTA